MSTVAAKMAGTGLNMPAAIAQRVQAGRISLGWPLAMLASRTLLFVIFGLLFVASFALAGASDPWQAAIPWWPYQVILANLVCYGLLRWLAGREGLRFVDLLDYDRSRLGRDLLLALPLAILAFAAGMAGLFGLAYWLFGTAPPETMFQPLPLWAALPAALALPLTNATVETTTYMGYSLPRLEAIWGKTWPAVLLAALALSVQHAAFPLILEGNWLVWRAFSFLPLALVVALLYVRLRRLMPLVMVHFVMDLQLALTVLTASL